MLVLGLLLPFILAGGVNALTTSLAGGVTERDARWQRGDPRELGVTGELPEQETPGRRLLWEETRLRSPDTRAGPEVGVPEGPQGIPRPMLEAYRDAADRMAQRDPTCGLDWSLLASIGRIESAHGRGGKVDSNGTTVSAVLGPRLAGGAGFAAIPDTDGGRLDGDPVWDRAVGVMQFLPGTWQRFGVDGNDDGRASPHNVHDAASAAARFLCAGDADLREHADLVRAVFRYNQSESYVREVIAWAEAYRTGVRPVAVPEVPEVVAPDFEASQDPAVQPVRIPKMTPLPPISPAPSDPGKTSATGESEAGGSSDPAKPAEPLTPIEPAPSESGSSNESGEPTPSPSQRPTTGPAGQDHPTGDSPVSPESGDPPTSGAPTSD